MNNLVVEIKTKKLNLQKRAEKTEQVCDCGLSRVNMLYTRKRKKGGEKKKNLFIQRVVIWQRKMDRILVSKQLMSSSLETKCKIPLNQLG